MSHCYGQNPAGGVIELATHTWNRRPTFCAVCGEPSEEEKEYLDRLQTERIEKDTLELHLTKERNLTEQHRDRADDAEARVARLLEVIEKAPHVYDDCRCVCGPPGETWTDETLGCTCFKSKVSEGGK